MSKSKISKFIISRDLIEGGASFTLKSNFQEYDDDNNELFPELLTGEEGILFDNENLISPWDKPFAELIPLMTDIGKGIYKKIVKQPVDNVEINGRCRVTIAYNAYMENENASFDSTYLRGEHKTFVTGDFEVLDGLELAVKSMKRKEESQFIIPSDLLFGKFGCMPRIKKEADALFVIQLINFHEIGNEDATEGVQNEDKRKYGVMVGKIMEVKTSGLDHFRQGAYVKAAGCFHRAINKLEMCQLKNEEEEKERNGHLIKLYVDAMVCYNKLDKPKQVCSAFRDLTRLTDTTKDAKALFQHGKALMTLGEYKRAEDALKKAKRLKPDDSFIVKQLRELDRRYSNHKTTETNLWRKAFGNVEPAPSQEVNEVEVSETFKTNINDIVTTFMNNPKEAKKNIPLRLTRDEMSYISDLVKELNLKLVTNDMQGKQTCYLLKEKNL